VAMVAAVQAEQKQEGQEGQEDMLGMDISDSVGTKAVVVVQYSAAVTLVVAKDSRDLFHTV
jgi:hypothetical protein